MMRLDFHRAFFLPSKELPVRAVCLLVALVSSPALLAAQIPIRVGQSLTGRLTVTDQQFADSSRYKMYRFAGNRGDTISAELVSDDFDANLVLADASGNRLMANDDSGDRCNARVTYVLPNAANYRLYANSSAPAELGEFRIALSRGALPAPADTVCRGFGRVAGLIEIGQTVTGTLTADDPEFTGDSTYFQRWILPVTRSRAFTIDLVSPDFDAYLILTKGRGDKIVENDDGGGGCDARLVYIPQDDHPVRIVVNTASRPRRQTGRFTLKVTAGELPTEAKGNCRFTGGAAAGAAPDGLPAESSASNTIAIGQTQQGALTRNDELIEDTTYAQIWTIQGRAGQAVTIDLESDAFDSFLMLRGPGITGGQAYQDDDSGGNCNARLTATFPQTGEYRIAVNTVDKRATGSFSLSVTSGSKPKSVQRCNRSQ